MNMLLILKEKIQKRQEKRLIKKLTRCDKKLESYTHEIYEGSILYCPICKASLNIYGDIYEIGNTNIVDHIKCNLCGFSLTRDYAPFIDKRMDEMLVSSKKFDKMMHEKDNKYINRGYKLVYDYRVAESKLTEFYMRRDGYLAECPKCKRLLNQYGQFNDSTLNINLPNYSTKNKSWHCNNCGTNSVWDFSKPTPIIKSSSICTDISKYINKEEKEKLCQTKKQSDN